MKSRIPVVALALLCSTAGAAFAQTAEGQGTATASGSASVRTTGSKKISVEYRGTLRDALKQIAAKGGLNLVVTGKLSEDAEVYLRDVTAEEALQSVAQAYDLRLDRNGKIWTLRPLTETEKSLVPASPMVAPLAAAPAPPVPPAPAQTRRAPGAPAEDDRATRETERTLRRNEARLRDAERQLRHSELRARVQEQVASRVARMRKHGDDDMVLTGGNGVVEEGESVEDVVVYGGNLKVLGHVNGDVAVFGGSVHLGPNAVIEGDITTFGGSLTRDDGAVIEGEHLTVNGANVGKLLAGGPFKWSGGPVHFSVDDDGPRDEPRKEIRRKASRVLPGFLLNFAVIFGLGFLFAIFAPARMKEVSSELVKEPMRCGLTGLAAAVALVPLTVLLVITLVGIPVAVAMWVVAAVGVILGLAVVSSEIGLRLPVMQGRKTQALILALGLLVVLVVSMVPLIGPLAMTLLALLGFGALVRTRFGNKPRGFPEPV